MKKAISYLVTLLMLVIIGIAANNGQEDSVEKTIYVGPCIVDCIGVAPQKCMLVKDKPDDQWSLFYDLIKGFQYDEGYIYELRVKEEMVNTSGADRTTINWTLMEIINKTEAQCATLENTTWVLKYYGDINNPRSVLSDTEITAFFNSSDNMVSGSAGCNRYSASYAINDSRMNISLPATTLMMCPEPIMEQEQEYLISLIATQGYIILGDQLFILYGPGLALNYAPRSEVETVSVQLENETESVQPENVSEPIVNLGTSNETTIISISGGETEVGAAEITHENTTWSLKSYGEQNNQRPLLKGAKITALFNSTDSIVSGSSGCNRYFAKYDIINSKLSISTPARTRMMCGKLVMRQEAEYLSALEYADSFTILGNELQLSYGPDRTLNYIALPSEMTENVSSLPMNVDSMPSY
ncbi:MAG: META domain-containing protein [Methanotrichaceae archaeon]|nr:META domain-containing protein [Methanotrichaceae archaeon]